MLPLPGQRPLRPGPSFPGPADGEFAGCGVQKTCAR